MDAMPQRLFRAILASQALHKCARAIFQTLLRSTFEVQHEDREHDRQHDNTYRRLQRVR